MKCLFLSIVAVLIIAVVGCNSTGTNYNSVKYPDSIIIKAFEKANVNPEIFSQRILRVVQGEIAFGRFTRQEVIDYVNGNIDKLKSGSLSYAMIGTIIDKYSQRLLMPKGDNISEAAMIAYYLFMPDLASFNIPSPVGPQDIEVAMAFLTYIRDGV